MNGYKQVFDIILLIAALLTAIVTIFKHINELAKKVKSLWDLGLRSILQHGLVYATLIVPLIYIPWSILYQAAENANRLREPAVFLSLWAWISAPISIYALVWGIWIYPKLKAWTSKRHKNLKPIKPSPADGTLSKKESRDEPSPNTDDIGITDTIKAVEE